MDSRQQPSHSFSRFNPQPQPPTQSLAFPPDPRYAPIPPPPYSAHSTVIRHDLLPHNDPFLPRRHKVDAQTGLAEQTKPYKYNPIPVFPAKPFAASHIQSSNDIQPRRDSYGSVGTPANGRTDGYGQAVGDSKSPWTHKSSEVNRSCSCW